MIAQTVTINYSPADVEVRQQINLTAEKLEKIVPALQMAIDAKLNRIYTEQRAQRTAAVEIKSSLEQAIREQLIQLERDAVKLNDIEQLLRELKEQVTRNSTTLASSLEIDARARCSRPGCVLLPRDGAPSVIHLKIDGQQYSPIGTGSLDISTIRFDCADEPHHSIDVRSNFEQSAHDWVTSFSLTREGGPGAVLHGTLSFTPRLSCSALTVLVGVRNSFGDVYDTHQTVAVEAPEMMLALELKKSSSDKYTLGAFYSGNLEFDLRERRLLPGWITVDKPSTGLGILEGQSVVSAGRALHKSLSAWTPPLDVDSEEYRRSLDTEWWDLYFYELLRRASKTDFWGHRFLAAAVQDHCEEFSGRLLRNQDVASLFSGVCSKETLARLSDLSGQIKKVEHYELQTVYDDACILGPVDAPKPHRDGWVREPTDRVLVFAPASRRRYFMSIRSGEESQSSRLEIRVLGEPDLWASFGGGIGYGNDSTAILTGTLGAALLWDVVETELGFQFTTRSEGSVDTYYGLVYSSLRLNVAQILGSDRIVFEYGIGMNFLGQDAYDKTWFFDYVAGYKILFPRSSSSYWIYDELRISLQFRPLFRWSELGKSDVTHAGYVSVNMSYPIRF